MFRSLKVARKLVLLGIVFSAPVALLLLLLVKEQNIAIDFGQNERRVSNTSSRFGNCSMTCRSIRSRFSAER